MTKRQENILSMWITTNAVLDNYATVWGSLSAFTNAVQRFRTILDELSPQARMQKTDITGITLDKQVLRQRLEAAATQTAANMQAFAIDKGNNTLQKEVHYVASDFAAMRDNLLPVVVEALLTRTAQHSQELQGYGLTADRVMQLEELLLEYKMSNATPRIAISTRKAATGNIARKIEDGNAALYITDKLIGNFADTHPDWVTAYRSARMVIDLGVHKAIKDKPATPQA